MIISVIININFFLSLTNKFGLLTSSPQQSVFRIFELHIQKNLLPPTFVFSTAAMLICASHILLLYVVKVIEGRVPEAIAAVEAKTTRVVQRHEVTSDSWSYEIHTTRDMLHLDSC